MSSGQEFVNKYNFPDRNLNDLCRQIAEILNGGLGSLNFTSVTSSGLTSQYSLPIPAAGRMYVDYIFYDGYYPASDISIASASIFAGMMPTGADITIDFLKNGAEQSKILTLATTASNHLQRTSFATELTYLSTDRLGLIVKTVGSTKCGRNLIVTPNIDLI